MDESGVLPGRYHSTMILHAHMLPGGQTIGLLVDIVQM
jgi:hypothetical protein